MPLEKELTNQEPNPEKENKQKLMSEEEYLNLCVDYALKTGWVKEDQKDNLINNYLKPIYQEAVNILQDIEKELKKNPEPFSYQEGLHFVIGRIEMCLKTTRRIGSTDPENILRSLQDNINASQYYWSRHVAEAMYEKVSEILAEK